MRFSRGWPVVLALVAACAVLLLRAPNGVETDLLGLADMRHGGVLREISAGLAGQGRVLLEGSDFDSLEAEAAGIAAEFGQTSAGDLRTTLRMLEGVKGGLLAPVTRALLLEGRYAEVAAASAARLFGLAPPLFSVKDDPFLLATDWAESLQADLAEGWSLRGGYPVCEREGRCHLLMTLDLAGVESARIAGFLDRVAARNAEEGGVRIWCGGAPFHSARASERARAEVGVLSAVSLAVVVLLGWILFRSARFVPELLVVQGVGFLVAAGALFAVFPRPHVLTFVFGTSLIGLSVDYVYHARAAGGARWIRRPLALALVTTLASFAPLCCAEVIVLRQMAVFTMAGLAAVYGSVVAWGDGAEGTSLTAGGADGSVPRVAAVGWRWGRIGCVLVALACACGVGRVRIVDDPAAFYRPDALLLAGERKLMELSPGQATRFVFVPGATLQEALEREEAAGVKGLSAVIPSLKRQRENRDLIARLVAAEGTNYTAKTGLKMPRPARAGLDPEQIAGGPLARMVRALRVRGGVISPLPASCPAPGADLVVVEPRAALRELFRTFTASTLRLLVLSLGGFVLLLAVLLRGASLRIAAPVMLALAATAGLQGWLGVPVTFFTLLCFFVLAGLGIDYSVFHAGNPAPGTRRTVFCSFLTSFAGLGMLAFTDFPVTRSMGCTFAVGLAFAYLLSRRGAPRADAPASASPARWHEQREQSAGRLRLLFSWWVYRLFGKTALKLLCVPVMAFIYPFAKPARRHLRAFYGVLAGGAGTRDAVPRAPSLFRHLLGFAWSLVDKTDACTLRKDLPRMSVVDDDGWRGFRELVAGRRGGFLISTHLGTIEVLPALASAPFLGSAVPPPRVHAFQQMGHDAVFTEMFARHFDGGAFALHAVEAIGVETAVEMQGAIARGELVLMAGDRVSAGSGKTLGHDFLGRPCRWPKGVFAFAKLMEAPVYFVTCVRTGWNAYRCRFRRFDAAGTDSGVVARMLDQYVGFLEEETRAYPGQWYQFYDFFSPTSM